MPYLQEQVEPMHRGDWQELWFHNSDLTANFANLWLCYQISIILKWTRFDRYHKTVIYFRLEYLCFVFFLIFYAKEDIFNILNDLVVL